MNQTVQQFIAMMVPVAQTVQKTYKVPTSVCIAQAALETGWGKSIIGNNYFGIKANITGALCIESPTWEVINGKWTYTLASFSQYTSLSECADEYGKFLTTYPRYKECFMFTDSPLYFTAALQEAGYATDPHYSQKLNSIITSYNLTQYDLK